MSCDLCVLAYYRIVHRYTVARKTSMVDMRHLCCYSLHQGLWEQCAVACEGLSHLPARLFLLQ